VGSRALDNYPAVFGYAVLTYSSQGFTLLQYITVREIVLELIRYPVL
jgi:hypothetical protein